MNPSTAFRPLRSNPGTPLRTKTLVPFLALNYGLTWGVGALLFLFTDQIVAIFGELTTNTTGV